MQLTWYGHASCYSLGQEEHEGEHPGGRIVGRKPRGCVPHKMSFPVSSLEPGQGNDPQDCTAGLSSPLIRVASSHPTQGPFQKQLCPPNPPPLNPCGLIPHSLHPILPLTQKERKYLLSQLMICPESHRPTSCYPEQMTRKFGLCS